MSEGKKRSKSQILGEKAVKILKNMFPEEWVVREYSPDYGLDLSVELFEQVKNNFITTGEHIYFQVKGTENIKQGSLYIKKRMNVEKEITIREKYQEIEVIKFQIETALLRTVEKMGSAVPVLLIVVDIPNNEAYYVCLNDYIEKVIVPDNPFYDKQKSIIINIPKRNIIHNKENIKPIEWYAKRAKLFALFNKANYQREEMNYIRDLDVFLHFANILKRLDAWKAISYFPALYFVKRELDYFIENKITHTAELQIEMMKDKGEDVDEPCWETNFCMEEISYREVCTLTEINKLWDKICNCGNILEDIAKEWFLPTYLGVVTRI